MARNQDGKLGQDGGVTPPEALATLYSGQEAHAIDKSNRIMLLPEWREPGTPKRFYVILVPDREYLLVCPPSEFHKLLDRLRASAGSAEEIQEMERGLNDRMRTVILDDVGRLSLPSEFLARARISKRATLVGRFSQFEVWPCEAYAAAQAKRDAALPNLIKSLQSQ